MIELLWGFAGSAMEIKEHLQLILSAGSTIDTLWNTFIGVHFALITAIYFLNRDFTKTEKGFLTAAYFVFAWLNYWALISSYELYDALVLDAKLLDSDLAAKFKSTKSLLMTFNYSGRPALVTCVHLLAIVIVITVIFLKERVIQLRQRAGAAPRRS